MLDHPTSDPVPSSVAGSAAAIIASAPVRTPIMPKVTGRPILDIDPEMVRELASIHCTMAEMAAVVGCSVDTLERRFADVIAKGKEEGRMSLRRLQWKSAQNGNIAMQIWLGKQLLGQKDTHQIEATGKDGEALTILAATPEYNFDGWTLDEMKAFEAMVTRAQSRGVSAPAAKQLPPGQEVHAATNGNGQG
jgi:AraC-like DNA-binding protein